MLCRRACAVSRLISFLRMLQWPREVTVGNTARHLSSTGEHGDSSGESSGSEFRHNKATNDWVVFATGRRDRPYQFESTTKVESGAGRKPNVLWSCDCPFCFGNEARTGETRLALDGFGREIDAAEIDKRVVCDSLRMRLGREVIGTLHDRIDGTRDDVEALRCLEQEMEWRIRVVQNRFPVVMPSAGVQHDMRYLEHPPNIPAHGQHEVIIERCVL